MVSAERQLVERLRQQGKAQLDALQAQRSLIEVRERSAAAVVGKEQERLTGFAQSFGLQDPLRQRGTFEIARKLRAGARLTPEELAFAQTQPILEEPLQRFGARRAQASPLFGSLLGLTGQDQPLRQAVTEQGSARAALQQLGVQEAAVQQRTAAQVRQVQAQVNAAANVAITVNPDVMAEQLAKLIVPQIRGLALGLEASFRKQLADALGAFQAGRRAAFGS